MKHTDFLEQLKKEIHLLIEKGYSLTEIDKNIDFEKRSCKLMKKINI